MNVDGTSITPSGLPARISFSTAGRRPASAARNPGSGYLGDIRRFSILEKELEYRLAKRWREHGDRKAADQIVTSHLRLAAKIAKNYRGYGLPISEIISEGTIGLMRLSIVSSPIEDFASRPMRSGGSGLRSKTISCGRGRL